MKKNNKGQVALIILLISAVVMTLGLSVSKKVTTETKIDTNEELSKQSFNAAESGIDYFLSTGTTGLNSYTSPNGDSKADVAINTVGGGIEIDLKRKIDPNSNAFFWLSGHDPVTEAVDLNGYHYSGNSLKLCISSGFSGSLSIASYGYSIFPTTTYSVKRGGYNFGTTVVENFTAQTLDADGCFDISSLLFNSAVSRNLLLSVTPLFKPTTLVLKGNANFPVQGKEIVSTGVAGDLLNGVSRKVTVFSSYDVPGFLLDAVSGTQVLSN